MSTEGEKKWDAKMSVVKKDDLESKLAAVTALEKLIAKNNINTVADINMAIEQYKEVLEIQLKGEK